MQIQIMLSATLRPYIKDYDPAKGMQYQALVGSSIQDLAEELGLPIREIKIVMLNGRHAELSQKLNNGDRLAFFPAVGGG